MIQEVHQEKEDAEDALLTEKEIGLIYNEFYYMNFYNISAFSVILLSLYKSNQNYDFVYTFVTVDMYETVVSIFIFR